MGHKSDDRGWGLSIVDMTCGSDWSLRLIGYRAATEEHANQSERRRNMPTCLTDINAAESPQNQESPLKAAGYGLWKCCLSLFRAPRLAGDQ